MRWRTFKRGCFCVLQEFEVIAQIKLLQLASNNYSFTQDGHFREWFACMEKLSEAERYPVCRGSNRASFCSDKSVNIACRFTEKKRSKASDDSDFFSSDVVVF